MADEQTMWSQTLLDGFIKGMQKKPSDAWIRQQAQELAERGMSRDFLYKTLKKDVSDKIADQFLNVVGGSKTASTKKAKKGFFGKLFS